MSTKWLKSIILSLGLLLAVNPVTAEEAEAATPFAQLRYLIEETILGIDHNDVQPKSMDSELLCMAETVYRESGSESQLGKLAVAQAIKNRMESPLYPKSACKVVKMRTKIGERIVCQFSPYCGPRSPLPTRPGTKSYENWEESVAVAKLVLSRDDIKDITNGAQSFYAHNITRPGWRGKVTLKIGGHTFVRTH